MDADSAESIALSALAFLAEDPPRLGRFLVLTGIGPEELRTNTRAPRVLAAVLDHLMQDENLLLVFAATHEVDPDLVGPAHAALEERAATEPDNGG